MAGVKKKKPKGKPGRPTKKDPEIVRILCKALKDCMPLDRACDLVGVGRRTVYDWLRTDPDFRTQVMTAKAEAVSHLINQVKANDPTGEWKLLRSLDHKNFGDELRIREIEDERDDEADAMTVEDLEKIAR